MPYRKPPWPSCDPIKHNVIVAKRAYDRSEKDYNKAKARVDSAEAWMMKVNEDSSSSRATRNRAREALLRARADQRRIEDRGEQNAETYKLAEEAMKRDRGFNLDRNTYDKAVNALEYADVENRYNRQEAERRSEHYDYQTKKHQKARDPSKVPAIGGGGFVGGGNTGAAKKTHRRKSAKSTRRTGEVDHEEHTFAGESEDAGWQDGGGEWEEVGDGDRSKKKRRVVQLSKVSKPSFNKNASGYNRPGNYSGSLKRSAPSESLGLIQKEGGGGGPSIPTADSMGAIGGSSVAFLREAEALLSQKDYKGAHTSAEYAQRLNAQNIEAYVIDAKALNGMGDYARAEDAARRALQLDPNNAVAYQELAWAMLHTGRYDQAAQMASLALRINGKNANALMIRAFAYEAMGKRDLMMADLERAASISSKFKPHLQQAKNGGQIFDPTRKDTISLLSAAPAFPMLEGKDPVKMGLFFFSALALGAFAVWQVRRKRTG
jgi:tetratricopeptide (TPR) repeat protein